MFIIVEKNADKSVAGETIRLGTIRAARGTATSVAQHTRYGRVRGNGGRGALKESERYKKKNKTTTHIIQKH